MKKSIGFLFFGFIFALYFSFHFGNPEKQVASENQSSLRLPAEEPSYCIAIRGNGELEPAHWGALARTVEQLGLPSAMAGGSSGTVSMFLMEAIASHPLVANQSSELQKERASLLLKSLLGFFTELEKTKAWRDVKSLYRTYQETKDLDLLKRIGTFIQKGQFKPVVSSVNKAVELGILDPVSAQPLLKAALASDTKRAQFYWSQLMETASVFGKFDAAHDDNLFFRAGIVSFEKASSAFGKIAAFYAAEKANPEQMKKWQSFMEACAPDSIGQTWTEITKTHSNCDRQFHSLFKTHFEKEEEAPSIEDREIGKSIRVYPTTTVLTATAANQFQEAVQQYHEKLDAHFGKDFHLKNPEEVRFGYWGSPEKLQQISQSLDPSDEKSRRFLPFGKATWKQILSLSPAEPGLSPLKEFTFQNQKYISAGGWSDLHPVLVLKAAGCEQVIYITRQGGESLFAQGVAKRLLNFDRDWSLLDSNNQAVKKLNDDGDPADQISLWSQLYNLGNPSSSFNRSLSKANAVLCTNWNAFDVKKDFVALIEDSYHSSFWINPKQNTSLVEVLTPKLSERKPGCMP